MFLTYLSRLNLIARNGTLEIEHDIQNVFHSSLSFLPSFVSYLFAQKCLNINISPRVSRCYAIIFLIYLLAIFVQYLNKSKASIIKYIIPISHQFRSYYYITYLPRNWYVFYRKVLTNNFSKNNKQIITRVPRLSRDSLLPFGPVPVECFERRPPNMTHIVLSAPRRLNKSRIYWF